MILNTEMFDYYIYMRYICNMDEHINLIFIMPRGKSISPAQENDIIELYQQGDVSLKEIMRQIGIRSSDTIYRLLDEREIPRRNKLEGVPKSFYIEKDVLEILNKQSNISRYVNEAVRYYYESAKSK